MNQYFEPYTHLKLSKVTSSLPLNKFSDLLQKSERSSLPLPITWAIQSSLMYPRMNKFVSRLPDPYFFNLKYLSNKTNFLLMQKPANYYGSLSFCHTALTNNIGD